MAYCVSCGVEIPDTQRKCDSCLAKAYTSATLETPVGFAVNGQTIAGMIKSLFLNPGATVRTVHTFTSVIPGLIAGFLSSLLVGLATLVFINKVGEFVQSLNPFRSYGSSKSLMETADMFAVFFREVLVYLVEWAIFSLVLFGVAKLFKSRASLVQAFNVSGYGLLLVGLTSIALLILGSIHPILGIGVILFGIILSYLAVHEGMQPLMPKSNWSLYLVPSTFFAYYLTNLLIIKVLAS